ncbi:MAG: hypothetical protein J7L04_02170 [Bacteroidales bacterium]|nr:hypothetical protein [Bacteroidales bacterium]
MDTDDLSREAHDAIIIEAERLAHDLTLHFGVLSSDCKDETDYLEKSKLLAQEIKQLDDFDLDDLFFGNIPDKEKMKFTLDKMISNIERVNKIPLDKRHFDY